MSWNAALRAHEQQASGGSSAASGEVSGAKGAVVVEGKSDLENSEDIEKEARAMRCFFHPNMPFRTSWDLVQVALLLYLLVLTPIRIAFGLDVEFGSVSFWVDTLVDIYFWTDIFVNFRTACECCCCVPARPLD